MGLGALFFIIGGYLTEGIRLETQGKVWLYILGLALPATAISNMALVKAIKHIGPTLTSIFGAMEPLTAVFIGIVVFHETSTIGGILGMLLIIIAVFIRTSSKKTGSKRKITLGIRNKIVDLYL